MIYIMDFTNIVLNTTDLGCTKWEDVEKLQPGEGGFLCFISYEEYTANNEEDEPETHLRGIYAKIDVDHLPTYKEVINYLISAEYPNGKEQEMLRLGINNPNDEEYVQYNAKAEYIRTTIKALLA